MRAVNCNCQMPEEVYWDWLEDEGWDASELRLDEQCVFYLFWPFSDYGCGTGYSTNDQDSTYDMMMMCGCGYWGSYYTHRGNGFTDEDCGGPG